MADRKAQIVTTLPAQDVYVRPDSNDVLFSEIRIMDVPHHLTFLRVERDAAGYWIACAPAWQEELEQLLALAEPDGELWPVSVPNYDGEYLAYVYPFTR